MVNTHLDALIAQHYFGHTVQKAVDNMEAFTLRREWANAGDYYFHTPGEGTELVAAYSSDSGALGRMLAALEADERCLGITLSWSQSDGGGQWRAELTWAGQDGPVVHHAQDEQEGVALGRALLAALRVSLEEQKR